MMFPSHLLATVLAGLLISKIKPWGAREWALALAFGVAIDLDHFLQIPKYAAQHGGYAALFDARATSAWGAGWQGFMHEPWALLIVAGVALGAASWIPLGAWGLHMFLDFVVARHFVRFGGPLEWAIVAGLAVAVLALLHADHRALPRGGAFPQYVRERATLALVSMVGISRR